MNPWTVRLQKKTFKTREGLFQEFPGSEGQHVGKNQGAPEDDVSVGLKERADLESFMEKFVQQIEYITDGAV